MPLDIGRTSIDMLSCSAHKLHGPKGVGCLYLRRGSRFRPLRAVQSGPRHENIAGIVGMGAACELAQVHLPGMNVIAALRDRLESELVSRCPR